MNKLYPALDINANQMELQQDSIKSSLKILISEIESGDLEPVSAEVYPLLLKAYGSWISAISQTRIYSINRLAAFEINLLKQQGKSLDDIYNHFMSSITRLKALYTHEDSFEGTSKLKEIEKLAVAWHELFGIMRQISESNQWRTDTLLMKERIFPLVQAISHSLDKMAETVKNEKRYTDHALSQSDATFNLLIFAIITLFLLFIVAILFSMDWMIFTPIQRVTQALKSKAFDLDLPHIESANTDELSQLIEAFKEMDEEVTQRQKALEYQATHDHLTGLANRFQLNQLIDYQIRSAERDQTHFSIFLMDLDFFKDINDTLGHAVGDQLLVEVSKRIQSLIRKSDTVARLGGDEFAVILPNTAQDQATELAQSIIDYTGQPFELNTEALHISISIGIVDYPSDGENTEVLLQQADMAMYSAKRKRSGYSLYNPNENIYNKERFVIANELSQALENKSFEVFFQPKVTALDHDICGAEALLRWNHPQFGFIAPDKVIEVAERQGIIQKLSLYIIDRALSECNVWHQTGMKINIAVNLSVSDLSNTELSSNVEQLLQKYHLAPKYLTFEITESVMMENLAFCLDQLNQLHKLGVQLSIDDFGTGFSSLSYLKRLPVNELKIDKSFRG